MCASAPDTSRADATADKLATLSADQFNWVKQQYEAQAPDRALASEQARQIGSRELTLMDRNIALGDEAAADYRTTFRPLEQKQAEDALNYNSAAHASELAGRAQVDVQHGFATASHAADRNMASMGINPNDGAYASVHGDMQRDQALAEAGARTKARSDADTIGRAMTADAIATGRGVVGSQATTAGIALNSGGSAVGSYGVPVGVGQGGVGMVQGAANGAVGGLNAAGNIYERSAQMKYDAGQASSQGVGALAGAAMTAAAIF